MFKKIINLFKKNKKESEEKDAICGLITYIEEDGQMYVYIRMSDYSDESLDSLANLISMYNPSSMIEVLSIIKNQLEKDNKMDVYNKLLEVVTGILSSAEFSLGATEEEPCINPSDVI